MNRTSIFASTRTLTARLMNAEGEGSVGGTAAPEVKLTRAEKLVKQITTLETRIAADTTKLAEVKLELETSERLSSVGVGTLVTVKLGRAETTREVAAEVLGVKDDDNGARRYKISYGEGFDADVVIIQPSQIVAITGQIS
jgi:hypothetical protein